MSAYYNIPRRIVSWGGVVETEAGDVLRPIDRLKTELRDDEARFWHKTLTSISHDSLLKVIQVGKIAETEETVIVYESVRGVPFDSWCASVGYADRINGFRELCKAIHYLHSNSLKGRIPGLVHGTLCPASVLVSSCGLKVADIGASQVFRLETKLDQFKRYLVEYVNPARNRDRRPIESDDVYALAVILNECVAADNRFESVVDTAKAGGYSTVLKFLVAVNAAEEKYVSRTNTKKSIVRGLVACLCLFVISTSLFSRNESRQAQRHDAEIFRTAVIELDSSNMQDVIKVAGLLKTASEAVPFLTRDERRTEIYGVYLERLGDYAGKSFDSNIGKFTEARLYYENAAEIFRLTNSPRLVATLEKLGLTLVRLGKFEPARRAYTEAVTASKKLNNSRTAFIIYKIGDLFLEEKNVAEAEKFYLTGMKTPCATPKDHNFSRSIGLYKLSHVESIRGNSIKAIKLAREATAGLTELCKASPDDVNFKRRLLACKNREADCLEIAGRIYESVEILEHVFTGYCEIETAHIGNIEYRRDAARTALQLGETWGKIGNLQAASRYFLRAWEFYSVQSLVERNDKLVRDETIRCLDGLLLTAPNEDFKQRQKELREPR